MNENKEIYDKSENYTVVEKTILAKSALILTILSTVFTIVQLGISLIFYLGYINDLYLLSLIGIDIIFIFTLIVLSFWLKFLKNKLIDGEETHKARMKNFNKTGFYIFYILLIGIIFKLIIILGLYYDKSQYINLIKAKNVQESFDPMQSTLETSFNVCIAIQLAFFCVNSVIQCFIFHSITSIQFSLSNFRMTLIFTIVLALIFEFLTLYYSKNANNYLISFQNSESIMSPTLINSIFIVSIVLIILDVSGIAVNLSRWRSIYLMFGALNLIFSLSFLTTGSLILRNSSSLFEIYSENCPNLIRLIDQKYLSEVSCPYKYKTNDEKNNSLIYNVDCPINEIGIIWDNETNDLNEYKLACLNYDCCDLLASSLISSFVLLGLTTILITLLGFVISSVSFYLSSKSNTESKYYSKTVDFFSPNADLQKKSIFRKYLLEIISFVIFISIVLIFILVSSLFQSTIYIDKFYYPEIRSNNIQTEFTNVVSHNLKLYNLLSSNVSNQNFCNNLNATLSNTELNNFTEGEDSFSVIRIALLALNAKFSIVFQYSSPNIKLFNVNLDVYKSKFFPNADKYSDFIIFEGVKAEIQVFLENSLKICSYPYLSSQIQYLKYVKPQNNYGSDGRILELINHKFSKNSNKNKKHNIEKEINHKSEFPSILSTAGTIYDSYTWGHLTGIVYDSDSNIALSNVKLSLIPWRKSTCDYKSSNEVLKEGLTNEQGKVKFFNLIKKSYSIIFTKSGYKKNCITIEFSSTQSEQFFVAVLVKDFTDANFHITLEWNNNTKENLTNFDLQLQATSTLNQKTCFSSIYLDNCQEMSFNGTKIFENTLNFQKIIIKNIFSTNYLFFLQKLPFYYNKINGTNNKNELIQSSPMIKIYSSEMTSPISQFSYPLFKNETENMIWMIFCFDGKNKQIIFKGNIWKSNEDNLTNITNGEDISIPNSFYCNLN